MCIRGVCVISHSNDESVMSVLQCVAACCSVLQCVVVCCSVTNQSSHIASTLCNAMHHAASHCNTLQHTATHCNSLQHIIECEYEPGRRPCTNKDFHLHSKPHVTSEDILERLQHTATHCNTLQRAATHCNTLQRAATHCNTLQSFERRFMRHKVCLRECKLWCSQRQRQMMTSEGYHM